MEQYPQRLLFSAGDLIISPGFDAEGLDYLPFLIRHLSGDWERMPLSERASNFHALEFGQEVLSIFSLGKGRLHVGVMTESDRSFTFIFMIDPPTGHLG